jgi:hypothetical protein
MYTNKYTRELSMDNGNYEVQEYRLQDFQLTVDQLGY